MKVNCRSLFLRAAARAGPIYVASSMLRTKIGERIPISQAAALAGAIPAAAASLRTKIGKWVPAVRAAALVGSIRAASSLRKKVHKFPVPRAVTLVGAICVAALFCVAAVFWHLTSSKSVPGSPASGSSIWSAASCRTGLFLQKAQGGIPDLSWTELWKLATSTRRGFHCMEGRSLAASFMYTEQASEDDRRAGDRIFR